MKMVLIGLGSSHVYCLFISFICMLYSSICFGYRKRQSVVSLLTLPHMTKRSLNGLDQNQSSVVREIDALVSSDASDVDMSEKFRLELQNLKQQGLAPSWGSTNIEPYRVTKEELLLASRTSFSTGDYYQLLMDGASGGRGESQFTGTVAALSAGSVLFSVLIVPQLPLSTAFKNVIGLFTLFLPFLLIGINVVAPGLIDGIVAERNSARDESQRERIAYHEAGHFLAGYLCGVPIIDYDVNGDRDAGLEVLASLPDAAQIAELQGIAVSPRKQQRKRSEGNERSRSSTVLFASNTGNLLIVAMAGMIAETLRFGDARGGIEDFPVALTILRRYGIQRASAEDVDAYLRWAVLKALVLLRLHRDVLDELAEGMMRGCSVGKCADIIECTIRKQKDSVQ